MYELNGTTARPITWRWFHVLACPRYAWVVVAVLLLVHSGLLAYSAYVHSPTLNEPAHLAAGIHHWQTGEFGLYRVNPPLVRMVAALPALAVGIKTDWRGHQQDPVARPDFAVGDQLIAINGERSFFLFMIARWACIPFSWIGGVVCFLWARDLYDSRAGILATTLWCISPNILAHASLITPDAPATALYVAACYLFWRWLRSPTWEQAILAGLVLGAAELAKTTFIVLFLFLPLLWVLYRIFDQAQASSRRWVREGALLVLCLAIGMSVVNLGYGFEGSFTRLAQFPFVSGTLNGQRNGAVGNRFENTWVGSLPVPFPKDYVLGIDVQRRDFEHFGRPSYLAGEFKDTGWWYYYLYALVIKVPLGISGLLLLSIALRFVKKSPYSLPASPYGLRDDLSLVLPAVLILTIVSCQTGFSEHLRYALPLAPFVFVWISQIARTEPTHSHDATEPPIASLREGALGAVVTRLPWRALVAGGLLVWSAGSSLWVYPHSLAYFNELVGGPAGGNAYLLGSNADWGQDLRYLKWWLDAHPSVDSLQLAYCGRCDPIYLGFKYSAPPSNPQETDHTPTVAPGWYAISVNFLRGYPWFAHDGQGGYRFYDRNALAYFLTLQPFAVAGASIYIFHVKESVQCLGSHLPGRCSWLASYPLDC